MLAIPRDVGGTIRMRAPRRPDASPTVAVYNKSGGAVVAAGTAATLSSVSTTLTGAHGDSVSTLTVASTTGMVAGDEIVVDTVYRPTDYCLVESVVSSTQVTLVHPTMRSYSAGVAVAATYVSFAITSGVANVSEKNWHIDFAWAFGGAGQPPLIVRFDVSRYAAAYGPPTLTGSPYPTINDIRVYEPKIREHLASNFDYGAGIQRAVLEVLRDLSAGRDGTSLVHDDDFRDLAALKFLADFAGPTLGDAREKKQQRWIDRYQDRFRALAAQMAADENQNRAIEDHERGSWGGQGLRG